MPNNAYDLSENLDDFLDTGPDIEITHAELSISIIYAKSIKKLILDSQITGDIINLTGYNYAHINKATARDLAIWYKGLSLDRRTKFITMNASYKNSQYWMFFQEAYNALGNEISWNIQPVNLDSYQPMYPTPAYLEADMPVTTAVDTSDSYPPNHYDKIVSAFGSIKPLSVAGLHVTENDLLEQLNKPCAYKSKHIAGCHDLMCRAFVYYATTHGETLMLLDEHYTSAPQDFLFKVAAMPETQSMCSSTTQHSCNKCGEFSSSQMMSLLKSAIGWECWRCYRSYVFKCSFCEETKLENQPYNHNHVVDNQDARVCKDCLEVKVNQCNVCERYYAKKPLFNGKCEKCTPSVIKEYQWKPAPVHFHGNGDPTKDPFFGIELEVEMKQGQEHYVNLIATRFQADVGDFVYIKKDSSISAGFEIVSHPGSLEYWQKEADKVFEGLRKLTKHCESWSVDNCGIHVHVGLRSFTDHPHMARLLMFINNNRLFSAFIAERYNAKQAPFLDMSNYDVAVAMATYIQIHDRHIAVNMQPDLPTIEVRIFKGNMRKAKILKDIEYVHAVQSYTRMQTSYSLMTVKDFIGFVAGKKEQYPNLYKYIAKYKKDI